MPLVVRILVVDAAAAGGIADDIVAALNAKSDDELRAVKITGHDFSSVEADASGDVISAARTRTRRAAASSIVAVVNGDCSVG